MFSDLLLNTHNLGPEVRFAPCIVMSDIQIESVEMGEGRNRNLQQSGAPTSPPALHTQENNYREEKLRDTVQESNPASHNINILMDGGGSGVLTVIIH